MTANKTKRARLKYLNRGHQFSCFSMPIRITFELCRNGINYSYTIFLVYVEYYDEERIIKLLYWETGGGTGNQTNTKQKGVTNLTIYLSVLFRGTRNNQIKYIWVRTHNTHLSFSSRGPFTYVFVTNTNITIYIDKNVGEC